MVESIGIVDELIKGAGHQQITDFTHAARISCKPLQ